MTASARVVLRDCRYALLKHRPELLGEEFRLSWVALMTLLRAMGYVLKEVDALQGPHLESAIDAAWKELKRTRPKPDIFWGFIDRERHNVVHTYQIGVSRIHGGGPAAPGSVNISVDIGGLQTKPGRIAGVQIGVPVPSKIAFGPYSGRDEREVAAEAVLWWEQYLDEVDREAAKLERPKE